MHMADGLLSPEVGAAMWAVTAGATAYGIKKICWGCSAFGHGDRCQCCWVRRPGRFCQGRRVPPARRGSRDCLNVTKRRQVYFVTFRRLPNFTEYGLWDMDSPWIIGGSFCFAPSCLAIASSHVWFVLDVAIFFIWRSGISADTVRHCFPC